MFRGSAGGRDQSANLSGMLGRIAGTVGDMGKAGEAYVQNVRDYSAPNLDTDDPDSLTAYSEWARRNGNEADAVKYADMATQVRKSKGKTDFMRKMAGYENAAEEIQRNIDRVNADSSLTGEQKAAGIKGLQNGIETIFTKMNDLGSSSQYGGVGNEGTQYRQRLNDRLAKREERDLRVQDMRIQLDDKLAQGVELGESYFNNKEIYKGYKAAINAANGNEAQIRAVNDRYASYIRSSFARTDDRAYVEGQHTDRALYNATRDRNKHAIAKALESGNKDAVQAAIQKARTELGNEAFDMYRDEDALSIEAEAKAEMVAAYDAGLARKLREDEVEGIKRNADKRLEDGKQFTRDMFPTQQAYDAYLADYKSSDSVAGEQGRMAVNRRHMQSINVKIENMANPQVDPSLVADMNLAKAQLVKDFPAIKELFDLDAEEFDENYSVALKTFIEDAEASIRDEYGSLDPDDPRRRQITYGATVAFLERYYPTVYANAQKEAAEDLKGAKQDQKAADIELRYKEGNIPDSRKVGGEYFNTKLEEAKKNNPEGDYSKSGQDYQEFLRDYLDYLDSEGKRIRSENQKIRGGTMRRRT